MKYVLLVGVLLGGCATLGGGSSHSLKVVCQNIEFLTYSSQDTKQTQLLIRTHNRTYAVLCEPWITKLEREAYLDE